MFRLIAPRDLGPIPAAATTAFIALAIFAWTERTILVDPEGMSVPYWPWEAVANRPIADGIRRYLVGLVSHPRSPLGSQPGTGYISPGSARQRIQRPVRRPLG